jgi:aspartyl protease family protein
MGTFRVSVEIGDPGGGRYEPIDALVDTGATYTTVPGPVLGRLGVTPHTRDTFVLADGRRVERDIGRTWVRIDGRTELTLVVFGDPGTDPLLGAYTLEGLRLAADPVSRRLVPVPALLLRSENSPRALYHPRLPAGGRLWGAGRPGYPDVPASPRQIEATVREWASAGVEVVVTLMEDAEVARICPGFLEALERRGLESLRYPIPDFGAPDDPERFCALVADVRQRLARGQAVLVHCNAGLGRTAIFLASLLKGCGYPEDPVLEIRRIYQPHAMEGPAQESFVRGLLFGPNGTREVRP